MGGGNFITQSYPTNFHTFHSSVTLSDSDSPDNYMEVTASEKSAIENSDAAWVRPSAELIAWYNLRCNFRTGSGATVKLGQYNLLTGFFELGETKDITTEEVLQSKAWHQSAIPVGGTLMQGIPGAVVLPVKIGRAAPSSAAGAFQYSQARVIAVTSHYGNLFASDISAAFANSSGLREIAGTINLAAGAATTSAFAKCRSLRIVWIRNLASDISFADSPDLRQDCIDYMVENAANTGAITITLHAEAFGRLTHELIAMAAERQITFASA